MKKYNRYEVQPRSPIKINTYHFFNHPKIWRHWHEYLEIIYFVSGNVKLKIDDKVLEAVSGDILVFNCFETHESISLSPENEYYVFVVPPEYLQASQYPENSVYDSIIRNDVECRSCLKNAASLVDKKTDGWELLLNSEIFRFLFFASQNHIHESIPAQAYKIDTKLIIEDIQNRIERCYMENIDLNLLANAFFISVSYLQHTFKEQTGYRIIDYLNKTRIENAAKLLIKTDLHISEISAKVGIPDYNYFSKVFRKYKNMTPTQYREKYKEI